MLLMSCFDFPGKLPTRPCSQGHEKRSPSRESHSGIAQRVTSSRRLQNLRLGAIVGALERRNLHRGSDEVLALRVAASSADDEPQSPSHLVERNVGGVLLEPTIEGLQIWIELPGEIKVARSAVLVRELGVELKHVAKLLGRGEPE